MSALGVTAGDLTAMTYPCAHYDLTNVNSLNHSISMYQEFVSQHVLDVELVQ